MPALYHHHVRLDTAYLVWACEEPPAQLLETLPPPWRQALPRHPDRLLESLGARHALLALGEARRLDLRQATLHRDQLGKPSLSQFPHLRFSLSHSHRHAAALLSDRRCGLDLQLRVPKILRLRSKFERDDERTFISHAADEVAALHILFGAKEALFKLWGARGIDWHEHLVVLPFDGDAVAGAGRGEIRKHGHIIHAELEWRWVDNFCVVAATERSRLE